jgi:peptidoglycan/LPS O-acetylase OafA/YrhL
VTVGELHWPSQQNSARTLPMLAIEGVANAANPRPVRHLAALDGLRAVSIGLVILGHVSGTQGFPDTHLDRFLGDYANLGVIVFFVISGYLITTLLLEEQNRFKRISLRLFYARRFLRLMPALFMLIACIVILQAFGVLRLNPGDLTAALTYTVNFRSNTSHYIGHLWSLSVEEQFYFLWPASIVLAGTRKASYAAGAMILISPVSRLLALQHHVPGTIFPCVADSLACGCLLSICGQGLERRGWYRAVLVQPWFVPAAVVLMFLSNAVRVYVVGITLGVSAINILCSLIIHRCMLMPSRLAAFLSLPPLVLIGQLSYSLYLWQQLFLNRHSTWLVCRFPVNVLLAALVASASYYLIERPLNRLRQRLHPAHIKQAKHGSPLAT